MGTQLFKRDIHREIETVIKADDRAHIYQEVEEYVITRELNQKLGNFFDIYLAQGAVNGAWISGFFGSGKSHLLKILSYILSGEQYDGKILGDVLADQVEDEMLKASIKRAAKMPAQSILFNIDQQADITNKQQEDAILSVFYKVFYNMQGFYGKQGHIAQLEKDLQKRGLLEDFKSKIAELSGSSWEEVRKDYIFDAETIATAYGDIKGIALQDAKKQIDQYENNYKVSIEDFAEQVNEYIERHPSNFRLNFLVDEIGQYIGTENRLMLNLQTIAESLATKTQGRAWVLVTSQEDIDSITSKMDQQQRNDFSRIQARFAARINLTSNNVEEVIQKRLLDKTGKAHVALHELYGQVGESLSSRLFFNEESRSYTGLQDASHFARIYPFLPYQFDLFQSAIRGLSDHNAFQGRHAAVGERSMLGVFKAVASDLDTDLAARGVSASTFTKVTRIASFDLMFEGIRSTIRGSFQASIQEAERQLHDLMCIRALKALFLVKYIAHFKASVNNMAILLMDDLQVSWQDHIGKVKQALNILERQTYIQRNGPLYEFLTDQEKDIENEIKQQSVGQDAIQKRLAEIIFKEVLKGKNKIVYHGNKQSYDFGKKIDNSINYQRNLSIHIITSAHPAYEEETTLLGVSTGQPTDLFVRMPADERLEFDLHFYEKTSVYVKRQQGQSQDPDRQLLLAAKQKHNSLRYDNLVQRCRKLLGEATLMVYGSKLNIPVKQDGEERIHQAFQELVKSAYPRLSMITASYSEETIRNIFTNKKDLSLFVDGADLSEAELEVFNWISRKDQRQEMPTLFELQEHFAKQPFGWYLHAVFGIAAQLVVRNKIVLYQAGEELSFQASASAFLKNNALRSTRVAPQAVFDASKVRRLREWYSELFDKSCDYTEAKEVAEAFIRSGKDYVHSLLSEIKPLMSQYPFIEECLPVIRAIERVCQHDYRWILQELEGDRVEELIDDKEEILVPILQFLHGDQRKIFDRVNSFIQGNQANISYFKDTDDWLVLKEIAGSKHPYKKNRMQKATKALDALKDQVMGLIQEERGKAIAKVKDRIFVFEAHPDKDKVSDFRDIKSPLEGLIQQIEEERFIGNMRELSSNSLDVLYTRQLNLLAAKVASRTEEPIGEASASIPKSSATAQSVTAGESSPKLIRYISHKNIIVNFHKPILETEADVEKYVDLLRDQYREAIRSGKKISL